MFPICICFHTKRFLMFLICITFKQGFSWCTCRLVTWKIPLSSPWGQSRVFFLIFSFLFNNWPSERCLSVAISVPVVARGWTEVNTSCSFRVWIWLATCHGHTRHEETEQFDVDHISCLNFRYHALSTAVFVDIVGARILSFWCSHVSHFWEKKAWQMTHQYLSIIGRTRQHTGFLHLHFQEGAPALQA